MSTHRILLCGLLVASSVGCASLGTEISLKTAPATPAIRAVDQEVLSDAMAKAFAQLRMPTWGEPGRTLTSVVEVRSISELPAPVLAFASGRATAAAGLAGIGALEVRRTLEKSREGDWRLLIEEYPETDARVVLLIDYAGVDERVELLPQRTSQGRARVLVGRFQATLAVVPRNAAVTPFTQVIKGESRYELTHGKFLDAR